MTLHATPTTKRCSRCKIVKDAAEFNQKSGHPFALSSWCRVCQSEHRYLYRMAVRRRAAPPNEQGK
jgi:hypothetical protein